MKTNHFFWGIFLTVLGLLFLIDNFFAVNVELDFILKLWPVILILIGLRLILKNKIALNLLVFVTAVLLSFIVYAFIFNPFHCGNVRLYRDMKKEKSETISHFYSPQIKNAKLNVEFNYGMMKINSSTKNLIDGEVQYKTGEYKFDGDLSDTSAFFFLNSEVSKKGFDIILPSKKNQNQLDLRLHQNPEWDIKILTNISDFNLDFTEIKAKDIKIESNFSSGKIKLGQPAGQSTIYVDVNFSSIDIDLPDNAAIEIITDKNFSSVDINGLEKIEKNIYRSRNFDKSKDHFVIELSSNFSSVTFH
ncbi:MAG: hypothetical protein HPY57_01380 [Ignavibacteria bacterium]|nr:hypothetical protein [Ignavibacteria bacterium]